jgi:hypothetical protein
MKMISYREVRVRPVVRYIVTYFEEESGDGNAGQSSVSYGMFENADHANIVGQAIAEREQRSPERHVSDVVFEPVRPLKIHWLRGPGEPQEAIRWELRETGPSESGRPV